MKKTTIITWISVVSIIAISVLAFTISNSITAQIPSASSYAPTFKDWSVQFSESMNPETFTNDTVKVYNNDNESVSVDFEWNDDNTILTLKAPKEGYTVDESYQINISDQVETANGKGLSKSFVHSFQTVEELPKIKDQNQLITLLEERIEKRQQQRGNEFTTMEDSEESADTAAGDGASNESSTSETNVQVEGIDEGDSVKTDGDYVYFARDNDIVIASTDENNSNVVSKIQEEKFQTRELFLHDDLLVSIGHTQETIRELKETEQPKETTNADIAIYPPVHSMQTTTYVYDISDKENPERIREFTIEGSLTASRKMDGFLYLVANNHPPVHIMGNPKEDVDLEDMEVRPFVKDTSVSDKGKPVDFEDMYFFPESNDESFMLISSIDLNDMDKEAKVETYLGASNQMYMSQNHIYTAANKYDTSESSNDSSSADTMIARTADTEIIQFKIDGGAITYNASTVVNGSLINQFAMDKRNDTFRVATTKGDMWRDDEPSTNNLYTFDTNLNPLGEVEGLAEGERIYSVRFMENVAYMVTFKQVDPLFVIDLEDAKNPTVLGELKIPGFSNYLHPLDDNHVIGFGQHTDLEEVEGSSEPRVRQRGLKISVFDVSDPANPTEKFSEILGQGGSHSEINYNHKSLFKHPEKNLFGFPAQLYESKIVQKGDATYEEHSFVYEGAFLYEISPESGITLQDTITHQADNKQHPEWESQIQRMVSVDDYLYTLSFDQMKVYNMTDSTITKAIELPELNRQY
ncbi:beta-propeller domain-containing protein [Virgibacillus byunsanensis]|uniref:Beta-propeller domain-containing protein n=1 Tax=Virgibacillus byunsanensis TaxID=570945 RepID=A0ABW3LJ39_9BACI